MPIYNTYAILMRKKRDGSKFVRVCVKNEQKRGWTHAHRRNIFFCLLEPRKCLLATIDRHVDFLATSLPNLV